MMRALVGTGRPLCEVPTMRAFAGQGIGGCSGGAGVPVDGLDASAYCVAGSLTGVPITRVGGGICGWAGGGGGWLPCTAPL